MIKFTKHFLKKLEDLLSELGFVLRYEKGNFQSGYCLVENRNILVVNKFFDTENRIQVIIDIIQKLDNFNENLLTHKGKTLLKNIKNGKLENLSAEEDIENKQTEEIKN
jgi:flagellin-specific chaperone FliS